MDGYLGSLQMHWRVILSVGVLLLGFGILISVIGRLRRKGDTPFQDRRVRVGRDNTGTIITGDLGHTANSSNDWLSKAGSWASLIGLLLTIISMGALVYSWLHGSAK